MWAEKSIPILIVIVMVVVGNLLFPACKKEPRGTVKRIRSAVGTERYRKKDTECSCKHGTLIAKVPTCKGDRSPLDPLKMRLAA